MIVSSNLSDLLKNSLIRRSFFRTAKECFLTLTDDRVKGQRFKRHILMQNIILFYSSRRELGFRSLVDNEYDYDSWQCGFNSHQQQTIYVFFFRLKIMQKIKKPHFLKLFINVNRLEQGTFHVPWLIASTHICTQPK